MAAAACCGQAVSLLDCVCVLPRTYLNGRLGAVDRKSHIPQTGPLALVSALSELQHVKTHLNAASECYEHLEGEEPVKLERKKARRKGKGKKAISHETDGSNSVYSRTELNENSPGFSVVRSVVNAEDSSKENRNGTTSKDAFFRASLKVDEENTAENFDPLILVASEAKSDDGLNQVNLDVILKKNLSKRIVQSALDVQIEQFDSDAGGSTIYTDNATNVGCSMDVGNDRLCHHNHERMSLEQTSVSTSRKQQWRRRKKSEYDSFEQGCGQTVLVTGSSDSITAKKKDYVIGHTQELSLADDCQDNEYAKPESHADVGMKPVRLEDSAELREYSVVERSKYLDFLPSHSSSRSNLEDLANEDSKPPSRKKESRNAHLKQRFSKKVAKIEGLANADMSELHSDVDKFTKVLDEKTLTNQSSTDQNNSHEDETSEQHMTGKLSHKKLLRDNERFQQSVVEAPNVGKGADTCKNTNAECVDNKFVKGLQSRGQTAMNLTAIDGTNFEELKQKEGSRLLQNSRRKRARKQPSTECINDDGDTSKLSECNQGMCTVRWLVETHLDINQKLFLVGENPHLGAWDPSMAVSLTLCEEAEKLNLWQGFCQVPYGTQSDYNYFVQIGNEEIYPRVWRPGPKLHLTVSPKNLQETEVIVKDFLDFNVANKLPALLWKGWQTEIGFPSELRRFFGDEVKSSKQSKVGNLEGDSIKGISKQKELRNIVDQQEDLTHLVLEHDVKQDLLPEHIGDTALVMKPQIEDNLHAFKLTPKLRKYIRKRVFPTEEPWLMESMILYERSDTSKPSPASFAETHRDADDSQDALVEKTLEKEEISTEILINSSKCAMERIAILEDGKLVELLLKPVNSDIHVGNVYLGIVKKLLPGMTGVFVDIGHPRVALLTITKNMYPFTFPPITSNDNPSNGYVHVPDVHLAGMQGVSSVELGQELEKSDDRIDEEWETEDEDDVEDEASEVLDDMEEFAGTDIHSDASHDGNVSEKLRGRKLLLVKEKKTRPITVNFGQRFTKWRKVEEGMRIIVQVKREPLGKKGPKVCAFPQLSSRFWVLGMGGKSTGVSKKIHGPERRRLKDLANLFRKPGFDLTVRTEAAGQSQEDLEKDSMRLLETWKDIMEQAKAASFAAEKGQDGAAPALLHRAMGQTLSIVRDFFADKVQRMVVDSAQTYHEVTSYLQEVAPQLQNRVELYTGTTPIFDVFNLEDDIDKLLNERVKLPNGAYLVIEETEALVTIDVNGGAGMLGKSMKSDAILEANLAAARQIAAELRLRDIGGIIVVDFIDMDDEEHESLLYEEMRNAIQLDRSIIYISEISELGLMELTRRRVRPSVTFMISDPCTYCHGTGRVEALETTFSKIERAILRLVANHPENIHFDGRTWKRVLLRVDPVMFEFLTRKQRAAQLSSSLKVYIILKVGREMIRGSFELSEINFESGKRLPAATGQQQQQRSLRKAIRLGAGSRKDFASRT